MASEPERNKALVLQMFDEAWNKGNLDFLKVAVSADFQDHPPSGFAPVPTKGVEALTEAVKILRKAMPDLHEQVVHAAAEDNRVVYLGRLTGTHSGSYMQFPASNKQISIMGIHDFRLENGKIVERWAVFDVAGMMQQMGIVPGGH